MTTGPLALCFRCARLREFPYCEGDPENEGPGIPVQIAGWLHDHHKPFPGDHGLTLLEAHPALKAGGTISQDEAD